MSAHSGKTILQNGDWRLVAVPAYRSWESWIIHACAPPIVNDQHEHGDFIFIRTQKCECGEKCPEEILNLWYLHNFDCIQQIGYR